MIVHRPLQAGGKPDRGNTKTAVVRGIEPVSLENEFKSGFIAIIGRTNVGKSTLLNRIMGRKIAIMSDKPQTTRNKILGVLTREHFQAVFLDTPGVHKPKHELGERLVKTALGTLREVDLVLFLVEADHPPGTGDRFIAGRMEGLRTPVLLVINKIDLIKRDELLERIEAYSSLYPFAGVVPVSALKGENVERLVEVIVSHLEPGPQYYPSDMVTDKPEAFVMSELIREKVLLLTSQEVPHSVAVVIEELEERPGDVVLVRAVIYTEKESQKGILIGKGGQMLKTIGKLAREEIEALFGSRIYLELWVKVKPGWRKNKAYLASFGYKGED
ncbi:MAG: GTPase Era [Firmicutes bacterium]|nr:GTPase Era [Bacillota bacterium]